MREEMRSFVVALLLAAASPALAGEDGRYAFEPAAGGVFRLDSSTGEVALCTARNGALVCVRAPAPAGAPAEDSDRLSALESRIAALETKSSEGHTQRGSEALARVKTLTERMMGRFVALVHRLKGDSEES
jgi:hypothetical protein